MTQTVIPASPLPAAGSLIPLASWREDQAVIEQAIQSIARPGQTMEVLEAGCGQAWYIKMPGIQYRLTGVDLDAEAMLIRKNQHNDLDEAIVGDLRTVELPASQYDVIYNAFVLEHVENAEQVLDNFFRWLKPGGIVAIRIPDGNSAYGFLTRMTPHWFHILFYRVIRGEKNAGKPGYAPYPTVYDRVVSTKGLYEYCDRHGYRVLAARSAMYFFGELGQPKNFILSSVLKIVSFFSLGKLSPDYINATFILQKP
jgi:SAM-dependent methyltransferase